MEGEEGIYEPAEVDADCATVAYMRQAIESQGQEVRIFGTPYSSDIRHLINSAGIEAITYGPGRASERHARDEHIMIDDLTDAARVVAAFALTAMSEGRDGGFHRWLQQSGFYAGCVLQQPHGGGSKDARFEALFDGAGGDTGGD